MTDGCGICGMLSGGNGGVRNDVRLASAAMADVWIRIFTAFAGRKDQKIIRKKNGLKRETVPVKRKNCSCIFVKKSVIIVGCLLERMQKNDRTAEEAA